jgi:hypothetical protein
MVAPGLLGYAPPMGVEAEHQDCQDDDDPESNEQNVGHDVPPGGTASSGRM